MTTDHTHWSAIAFGCWLALLALVQSPAEAADGGVKLHISDRSLALADAGHSACQDCSRQRLSARHTRAGNAHEVAWYAKPSVSKGYSAGYVGGGAAFRGEARRPGEGTWGRDYTGVLVPKRVWLYWLHGRPEPRGAGSYKTDGPHLLKH